MEKPWASDAKQLLNFLTDDDLFQLATTVCRGQFQFTSKNEAINAILAASESPNELLRKKKLKREYILRYIWEYGGSSETSALPIKADKLQLIREVLTLWGCAGGNYSSPIRSSISAPIITEDDHDDTDDVGEPSGSPDSTPSIVIQFAEQFLPWFYHLLNDSADGDDFGPQHFYGNCLLRLRCGTSTDRSADVEETGAVNVAQRLKQLITAQSLLFQPNLRPPIGYQAMEESHGAILLKSNGTVHRRPTINIDQTLVLGPYEQTFLVIEDPQTKTWKIQQSTLIIKAEIILSNLQIEEK